jgi:two-component sensor histidine kinase
MDKKSLAGKPIFRSCLMLFFIALAHLGQSQVGPLEFSEGAIETFPTQFRPLPPYQFSKPFSFWIKATVTTRTNQQAMLQAGNWYMQQVSFFDADGKFIGRGNHVEVSMKKGANTFYLFFPFADDKDDNGATVLVSGTKAFNEEYIFMRSWQIVFASVTGLLFLMSALYSIIIRSADRIYFYYAIYLLTIFIFFSYQHGLLGDVFGTVKNIPPGWFWIFSDFITITYLFFSMSFLDMQRTDPVLYRLFKFGILLVSAMALVETISYLTGVDVMHSLWYKVPIFAFELVIFPYIFYRVYKLKTILSWLFLLSMVVLCAANLAGQVASTLKAVSVTNYYIQAAMLIDAFLFSVGIGIRFGIINREKQTIQSNLIEQLKITEKIQEQNAAELETKVKDRTEALDKRNRENELLIKEIHHRVKNNLQVVSSLLNISERKIKDEAAKEPFRDSANRINSMGLIHSLLYKNDDYLNLDLKKYIGQLADMLLESFKAKYPSAKLVLDVAPVTLSADHAIEIGLVVNEIVTNSLKHGAYPDSKPVIHVSMHRVQDKLLLTVKDNGRTKPNGKINMDASFGMRMINALAAKMNGTVEVKQEEGFEVRVEIGS